ncbi:unnamed protein product [Paramecium sonneborni]|uniref:Transmembrane protein n=1 Tax=Paramecium sonneborni TaxID=65129 RepID=A0A8S1NH89_9CILI|nr:unnamed protein product [Paramecium sonneborni]
MQIRQVFIFILFIIFFKQFLILKRNFQFIIVVVKTQSNSLLFPKVNTFQILRNNMNEKSSLCDSTYGNPSNSHISAFWISIKQNTAIIVDEDEDKKKKENRIKQKGIVILCLMIRIQLNNYKKEYNTIEDDRKSNPNVFFSQRVMGDGYLNGIPKPYNIDEKIKIKKINERKNEKLNIAANNRNLLLIDKKVLNLVVSCKLKNLINLRVNLIQLLQVYHCHRNQIVIIQINKKDCYKQRITIDFRHRVMSKQDKRIIKFSEDQEDILPSRIQDQNIFELIFGDDDEEEDQQ